MFEFKNKNRKLLNVKAVPRGGCYAPEYSSATDETPQSGRRRLRLGFFRFGCACCASSSRHRPDASPLGSARTPTLWALSQVLISKEYLQLEPIGLVFVFFFALILVIQFAAMLFHRFGTLSHILASTDLTFCWNKKVSD